MNRIQQIAKEIAEKFGYENANGCDTDFPFCLGKKFKEDFIYITQKDASVIVSDQGGDICVLSGIEYIKEVLPIVLRQIESENQ